jgi:HSP20 family protein
MHEERFRGGGPDMPALGERIGRLGRALLGRPVVGPGEEGLWHPIMDVYNREEDILVQVELPGMKGQELNVSLDQQHLIIEGSREPDERFGEEESYYCERPMGGFHRVVHLPCPVDEGAITAAYDDGLLTVTLPKAARDRGRRIEIK